MKLRHKVTLRAFRDVEVGGFDSKREFSEPVECWANIEAVSAQRYIGNVTAFGVDRAVSHIATMRAMDLEVFTEMQFAGDSYKIVNTRQDPLARFMEVGLSIQSRSDQENGTLTTFENG